MKVTDLRRKLAAALVAGGMLVPATAHAADLDVNLLANPDFENLDATDSFVLDWTDGTEQGFTYASGNYDLGGPLAGGGAFYFSANGGNDITDPGQVAQIVDLSSGDSATLIGAGNAFFQLSAFMTSYAAADVAHAHVEFQDGGNNSLGTFDLADADNSTWTLNSGAGAIPVGTTTALVSVYGDPNASGPDGYLDNVDFRVTDEVILLSLDITVDRDDGSLVLSNQTGSTVNITGYQITSAFGGLDPAAWVSITDNYDADSGGSVDGVNQWSELTQSDAHGDLSEADLESGLGGSLVHTQSISLGAAGAWIRNTEEDLIFRYTSDGQVVTGIVNFVNAAEFAQGDVDTDGDIDADDWNIVRSNQHGDLSDLSLAQAYRAGDLTADGLNNHADFALFKSIFDQANGAGSFSTMLAAQSAIPEPSSLLVLACGMLASVGFRNRNSET